MHPEKSPHDGVPDSEYYSRNIGPDGWRILHLPSGTLDQASIAESQLHRQSTKNEGQLRYRDRARHKAKE